MGGTSIAITGMTWAVSVASCGRTGRSTVCHPLPIFIFILSVLRPTELTRLSVGRIHVTDDIEEVVARHFAEWGQVDRTRCLTARGVAFVTYTNEANSQFAKEAMAHQSLDHSEILNVRWATVDPNPMAQKREARKTEEQAAEAVRRALPEDFVREIEGRDPDAKRRKRIQAGFGLEGYEAPDQVWYARSRELEGGGGQAMIDGEERYLIEDDQEGEAAATEGEKGILPGSTLAALQNHTSSSGSELRTAAPAPNAAAAAPAGPLVGYGSDDDSD